MRAVRALGRAALELLVRLVYWPGKRQPIATIAIGSSEPADAGRMVSMASVPPRS